MPRTRFDYAGYVEDLVKFELADDPYAWVLYAFSWGMGELESSSGPDEWQAEVLCAVRDRLRAGLHVPEAVNQVIQLAVASGHGIGKSALVAWIILWAMTTFEDTRGVVTANTEAQLKSKTWAELAKWHRLCLVKDLLKLTAAAIYCADAAHAETWRIDMLPWNEKNPEAFAGLHNKGKRILIIFDEASAIADSVWEVTEGALTDEGTEVLWFAFGNPTRNTGRFRDCFGRFRHRWITKQIDSRSARVTNKELIRQWVEDYGEDSDFVRVRVRGLFPARSDRQFIATDLAEAGRGRKLREDEYNFAPVIMGVDPAWDGGDETVIWLRQGLASWKLAVYPKNDNDGVIAGYIARFEDEHKADAVFIDKGWGTGIYSAGKNMGRRWMLVSFSQASPDSGFYNLRAYMWNQVRVWLKEGGAFPDDQVMVDDLTGPEYVVKADGKILLEAKQDMKKRGLPSPNRADALALTFAYPVVRKAMVQAKADKNGLFFANNGQRYNPLARRR